MTEQEKAEYLRRMLEAMRPLTAEQLEERQQRAAPLMRNAGMQSVPGMANFWATRPEHLAPEPPKVKPTIWQRVKRFFVRHNVGVKAAPARRRP